jgi:hypothetical protein
VVTLAVTATRKVAGAKLTANARPNVPDWSAICRTVSADPPGSSSGRWADHRPARGSLRVPCWRQAL